MAAQTIPEAYVEGSLVGVCLLMVGAAFYGLVLFLRMIYCMCTNGDTDKLYRSVFGPPYEEVEKQRLAKEQQIADDKRDTAEMLRVYREQRDRAK
jgi:hypothetical protein